MRRQTLMGLAVCWCMIGVAALVRAQDPAPAVELVASTDPRTPEQEKQGFRLPPGFEVELVASEPTINKPMNLSFDDRGRLWVTSSLEYPYPRPVGEPGRDSVVVLEDFGPDGKARKATRFAEGLNIPIGVLALSPSEALVHSIPDILHMVDDDGDGRADRKEPYYSAIGYRDTHGMASAFTWGFDGWIHGCHGFANDSTIAGRDGQAIQLNSGNTYRMKADGSHIEQWTWGQVNPFGLAFSPRGDLFSCDCHSRPIMLLLRGGHYPSFGKPHDGLGFAPEIMSHDHGSTGIAGITYYAAEQFPAEYRDTILIGNVVTSRINHDRLEWTGSSPRAVAQPDFLVSEDPWFRPVDIELGPDGALYVADFYNRIIGHYEVPLTHPGRDRERGRIWRIVYRGDEKHAEAKFHRDDFRAATTEQLATDLGHSNIAVRIRAANLLCERGGDPEREAALQAANDAESMFRRAHGLHVLARLECLEDARLIAAFSDPAAEVRIHAAKVAAERRDWTDALDAAVLTALADPDAFVRRAAADAVGQHADARRHLRPLLRALAGADRADEQLFHTLRMALRNQLRSDEAWKLASSQSWSDSERSALADVAPGVPSAASAAFLLGQLEGGLKPEPAEMVRFVHHITRQGSEQTDNQLVAFLGTYWPENRAFRADLLREAFQGCQERGAAFPPAGRELALALGGELVASTQPVELICGCNLAAALKLGELFERVAAVAADRQREAGQRSKALTALAAIDGVRAVEWVGGLLRDSEAPAALRDQAAEALGQSGDEGARMALLAALPTAPARLQTSIAAALAGSREGAYGLLEKVAEGKASPRVLQERGVALKLERLGSEEVNKRLADLTASLPPAEEAIQELINRRLAGLAAASAEETRGKLVFEKHCGACHQLGGAGGRVGPQLDGVGVRGPERLLEDILGPNRNVDQAFRSVTLALENGQVLTGLPLREEGEIAVFADSKGEEIRVEKATIEERLDSAMSLMPANLAEQIAEPDFYDLLRYLLSKREAAAEPAQAEGSTK